MFYMLFKLFKLVFFYICILFIYFFTQQMCCYVPTVQDPKSILKINGYVAYDLFSLLLSKQ